MLTELENLKYQLQTLASYESADLDNPEFEVVYADECGNEGFASVCVIDTAKRSLLHIEELEKKVIELDFDVELPNASEIKQTRIDNGLSQTEAASLIYKGLRTWQQWEKADRKMDPAFWELFLIKCEAGKKSKVD